MKKLNLILATLGLVFIINACAPVEEVQPQTAQQKLEKFTVKNDEDTGGPSNPTGR